MRTPEARRAACMERLQALGAESEQLIMQKNALGKQKADIQKRAAILERLEVIDEQETE